MSWNSFTKKSILNNTIAEYVLKDNMGDDFSLYDGEPLPELNFEKVLKEQEASIKSKKEYNQKLLDEWCERWHLGKQFSYNFYYTCVDGLRSLDDRYKDKEQMLMELNMIDPYPEFTLYHNNWGATWSGFESANTRKEREKERQKTTKAVNDILLSLDLNLQEKKNELWNPGGNKVNFTTLR